AHPEVSIVLVSEVSGGSGVRPSGGRSAFQSAVAGYQRAWRALPPNVRHVVVIRDNPKQARGTVACIIRALGTGRAPGPTCAAPRRAVLDPDPAVVAARRMHDPR